MLIQKPCPGVVSQVVTDDDQSTPIEVEKQRKQKLRETLKPELEGTRTAWSLA